MICPHCQTANNPESKFCMGCGAPLIQTQAPEVPQSIFEEVPPAQEEIHQMQAYSQEPVKADDGFQEIPAFASGPLPSQPPAAMPPAQGEYASYSAQPPQQYVPQPPQAQQYPQQPPQQPTVAPFPPPPPAAPGYGQPPQGYTNRPAMQPASQKPKSKTLWIVLGALLAFLVILVVLFFTVVRPLINKAIHAKNDFESTIIASTEEEIENEELPAEPTEESPASNTNQLPGSEPSENPQRTFSVIDAGNASDLQMISQIGNGFAQGISYSKDGQYIAVASTVGVDVMMASNGDPVAHLLDGENVYSVVFTPQGQLLASTYDQVTAFNAPSFNAVGAFGEDYLNYSMQVSEDGNILTSDYVDEFIVYEKSADSYEMRKEVLQGTDYYSYALSPNGQKIATGDSTGKLKIWDITSDALEYEIDAHGGYINQIAWSSDGTLIATASDDESAAVWDASTGSKKISISTNETYCQMVRFSPDNKNLLTGSSSGVIQAWDINSGNMIKEFVGGESVYQDADFSPDGNNLIARDEYGQVLMWNYSSADVIQSIGDYNDFYFSFAVSPDGSQIFYLDGNSISVMARSDGYYDWAIYHESYDQILAPIFSQDGSILIGGTQGGYVNFLDAKTGEEQDFFEAHNDWIRDIDISADGSKIATASDDGTVSIWDYATHTLLQNLTGHGDYVRTVAFSPDGQLLASGGDDNTVRIWNVNTGMELLELTGHEDWVFAVEFTPDGSMLASGGDDDYVIIWDPKSGEQLNKISTSYTRKTSIEFTADGEAFWAPNGGSIELYRVSDGSVITSFEAHNDSILHLRMSEDGTKLFSAGKDGVVRIWAVE